MKRNLLGLFLTLSAYLFAASGDVTMISSHDTTELTWYGAYEELVQFPDKSKDYQQILMDFKLGCSDGGCSHWDYTVQIQVGEYTGEMDSTIASLDTVSQSPLVVDTTWNEAFEVIEWYELGRMITPYGNYMDYAWGSNTYGYDETWEKTWTYDVTMMEPLLHGNVPVRFFFSGWPQNGRGFSAKADFKFVEGVPLKRVSNIQKIYAGGAYDSSFDFEQNVVPSKNIDVSASHAELRTIITGHGAEGEFTPISYRAKSGSDVLRGESLWRNDCSENTLSPQGGTWIFNRANWCPGDDVEEHWFDYSEFVSNGKLKINIDFDDYSPNPGDASYIISAYLFEYETIKRLYDVSLKNIVKPSVNAEQHTIYTSGNNTNNLTREVTTICTNPQIEIENYGRNTLTYCQIEYGVQGGVPFYYEWTGSLKTGESTVVSLPLLNWNGLDVNNPVFYAEVDYPNHLVDQFSSNNRKETSFSLPTVYNNGDLEFRLRTNNNAEESSYKLYDASGSVLLDIDNLPNNSINNENISLNDGCYKLVVLDKDEFFFDAAENGGDGLSWWLNLNQNYESAGYFEMRQNNGGRLTYFNPDFGHKIEYDFMVGVALNEQTNPPTPISKPAQANIETIELDGVVYSYMPDSGLYFSETNVGSSLEQVSSIQTIFLDKNLVDVYPNPSNGIVNINVDFKEANEAQMILQNAIGETINQKEVVLNKNFQYDLSQYPKGIYFLVFEIGNKKLVKKVTKN